LKDRLFSEVLRSVNANMANVAIGAVLLLAATGAGGGHFTVGDFALFVSYLTRMAQWINFLGDVMAQHKRVGVSYERLVAMIEGAPPARLVEPAAVHLHGDLPAVPAVARTADDHLRRLDVRGLTFRHPSTGRGVEGIDLTIERGTLTVITGPIGSGKTTLLRALLGLLPRDGGVILWNGRPVVDPASFFVPPRCAYTPQVPRLFSEALRDNVLLGQPDEALEQALRLAVMERDVASFPDGLDTLVGPRGVRLSGGQIQRAAAARMFARQPELLVFDDLSSALDLETERQLWERLFGDGRRDATCLVVSHREAVLRRADQVIVLADGRLESRELREGSDWKQNRKIRASSPS
jgi:ABC-type multidrug transport system fused ATPase/permease subunit